MQPIHHLRHLWGRGWPLALLPAAALALLIGLGAARLEHGVVLGVATALACATPASRKLLLMALPGFAIGAGYELMRLIRPLFVTPDRVFACQMQGLELRLFGTGGQTLPDIFARHHAPVADLVMALPYTLFWGATILYCLWLYRQDPARALRFLWVLALTHAVAFAIWMALPVAPPWYVRAYGCRIDIGAPPSPAALLRLDRLFGMTYFEAFYSRAPTVFGAMPSLHVAFPTVALLTAWRYCRWPGRLLHGALVLWMLAASVYLDHHWLLDGLVSILIVLAVQLALNRLWPDRHAPGKDQPRPATDRIAP